MPLMNEIPQSFWSLFRSYNRETYIEALLKINEEYEYNNYYLSREVCIQVLGNYFSQRRISMMKEEQETDEDVLEPPATRILNWLVKSQWLRRLEDYTTGVTNIIIPDYSAVFLEAFERLSREEEDSTEIYIQNIYAILFSYKNDARAKDSLLRTALVNTKQLNKALQDMLHNMDKFFTSLLEKRSYGELLTEHLNGYVEEIVKKKYHILKTTDNFYIYKTDIKVWLREIRENILRNRAEEEPDERECQVLDLVGNIERGFDDIERRIANMDKEHTKYVRATVTRLNYLLNEDEDIRGLVIQLLNLAADEEDGRKREEKIDCIGSRMNFSQVSVLTEKSLYKRRRPRRAFMDQLEPEKEEEDLTREDVLKLNRLHHRYNRREIESFLAERDREGKVFVNEAFVRTDTEFEKLILAYDYATRKGSKYRVTKETEEPIDNGRYRYPRLTFIRSLQHPIQEGERYD